MNFIKIIFLCLAILMKSISSQDQLNVTQDQSVTIYSIKYRIVEERIPQILTNLVIENAYVNELQFHQVLLSINTTVTESFVNEVLVRVGYKALLEQSPIDIIEFARLIINQIPNRKLNLRPILELLGINYDNFMEVYTFSEENELYGLLETGTYSDPILSEIKRLYNISLSDSVVSIFQSEVVEPITHTTFSKCLKIFGRNAVTNLLNETLYEIQLSDISNNFLIYEVLTNYTDAFNTETIWAVETKYGILSIPKAQVTWRNHANYFEVYLQNIQNQSITRGIRNIFVASGKTYSVIESDKNNTLPESNIKKADDYTVIPNGCRFWRKANDTLEIINATDYYREGLFIFVKYNGFSLNLGSPFICDEKIYGMLTKQNDLILYFRIVGDVSIDPDNDDDDMDYDIGDDDHDGSSTKQLSLYCVFAIIIILLF